MPEGLPDPPTAADWSRPGPARLLLATEGRGGSVGAVRLAAALHRRDAVSVRVISVVEPPPVHVPVGPLGERYTQLAREAAGALEERVRSQLREGGDPAGGWEVEILEGPAARTLARRIVEDRPDLVVLGLGRKRPMDRLLGSEVAAGVVRLAPVPVLAVTRDAEGLPTSALVAVDFSSLSHQAVSLAADLVGPEGEVHLVHVLDLQVDGAPDWSESYRRAARSRLDALAGTLSRARGIRPRTHLLGGDAATGILGAARDSGVDLVSMGSHGHSFLSRLVLGSVSRKVLRAAERSVLVVPPVEPPELLAGARDRDDPDG